MTQGMKKVAVLNQRGGLLSVEILVVTDDGLAAKLDDYRAAWTAK